MKIKTLEEQFIYLPTRDTGEHLFEGEYQCDENIAEIIGQEGIEFIKNKILSIIENKKEMFGQGHISFYGMDEWQRFYDIKNRIMLDVKDAMLPENNIVTIRESLTGKRYKNMSNIGIYRQIKGLVK